MKDLIDIDIAQWRQFELQEKRQFILQSEERHAAKGE